MKINANKKALAFFLCLKQLKEQISMINELVQRFKIHLEEDGKSPKTIESYVGDTS